MVITAFNPPINELEKTYISSAIAAGITSIPVKNNNLFSNNDRIMIGEMGREKTEIVTVSSVSGGTSIVTGATVFSHDADDPIYRLRFDQVRFYRSTGGSAGTYSLLSTQALDVDNDKLITTYDDTSGTSSYYYKVSFYNSLSTLESSLSDPIAGSGYTRNQVGFLIDEILKEINDPTETKVTRSELLGYFNEVSDDLQTRTRKPYDFLHSRTTLTRTTARNYIDFPTDSSGNQIMWKFDRLDLNFTDSTTSPVTDTTYTIRIISPEEFRNRFTDNTIDSTTEDDKTQVMALDTSVNRFRFNPPFKTTAAGVFYLYYWAYFTRLDSEGDTFQTPSPRVYKLYAMGKIFRKLAQSDAAFLQISDRYLSDYNAEVVKLPRSNQKDGGSPKGMGYLPQTFKGWRGY